MYYHLNEITFSFPWGGPLFPIQTLSKKTQFVFFKKRGENRPFSYNLVRRNQCFFSPYKEMDKLFFLKDWNKISFHVIRGSDFSCLFSEGNQTNLPVSEKRIPQFLLLQGKEQYSCHAGKRRQVILPITLNFKIFFFQYFQIHFLRNFFIECIMCMYL